MHGNNQGEIRTASSRSRSPPAGWDLGVRAPLSAGGSQEHCQKGCSCYKEP